MSGDDTICYLLAEELLPMGGTEGGGATFGALLRRWRGRRGLTQAELAERSGLSVQAISLLERGARRSPRVTTVELLAEALGLDGAAWDAFHAAAWETNGVTDDPSEPVVAALAARKSRRPRWHSRGAGLVALLLVAAMAAAPLAWWRSHDAATAIANLVGARVYNWHTANRDVGPLQTQRIYHRELPVSFAGSQESRLPRGVVPVVSYRTRTANVASYVRSVNRRAIIIFQYNPEARSSAAEFVQEFEEQADLVHSIRNPDVSVAVSAAIYQYQMGVNAAAARCAYIPPPAYVDYYLAAVYDPYLQGISRTDHGGFVVWQNCTNGLNRPRGLVEYGLGLGISGSTACQPEAERTNVMRNDMVYLRQNLPDLEIVEYWWATPGPNTPCQRSWQFAAGSSTGDLWRQIANRAFTG